MYSLEPPSGNLSISSSPPFARQNSKLFASNLEELTCATPMTMSLTSSIKKRSRPFSLRTEWSKNIAPISEEEKFKFFFPHASKPPTSEASSKSKLSLHLVAPRGNRLRDMVPETPLEDLDPSKSVAELLEMFQENRRRILSLCAHGSELERQLHADSPMRNEEGKSDGFFGVLSHPHRQISKNG